MCYIKEFTDDQKLVYYMQFVVLLEFYIYLYVPIQQL